MNTEAQPYGVNDNSYKAAGELEGLIKLSNAFYDFMERLPEAKRIRDMHRADLTESRTKLAYFLSGWLGGPKIYRENFGPINIPQAHSHLPIGQKDSDAWILCMQKAVDEQPFTDSFKDYLITQLRVPAGRIQMACKKSTLD